MKTMKKLFAVLMAVCLTFGGSVVANAAVSTAAGTYEEPHMLAVGGEEITITIPVDGEFQYVKVDDNNGTIVTITSDSTGWQAFYGRGGCSPDENGDGSFEMAAQGYDFFQIGNMGEEDVTLTLSLAAGSAEVEQNGSMDAPYVVEMASNPWGQIGGQSDSYEVEEGAEGLYFKTVAPADGAIIVAPNAITATYDMLDFVFTVTNLTTFEYGDTLYSTDFNLEDTVKVSEGDEVLIWVSTYADDGDDETFDISPAGLVEVMLNFAAAGTKDCPTDLVDGDNTGAGFVNDYDFLESEYFFSYIAEEAGTLTLTFPEANWNYTLYDEYYANFGEWGSSQGTKWSDEEGANNVVVIELEADQQILVGIAAYDDATGANVKGDLTFNAHFVSVATQEAVTEIGTTTEESYEIEIQDFADVLLALEVLAAAREAGVDVVLVTSDYTWTIDASTIVNTTASVDLTTNLMGWNVPFDLIAELGATFYEQQISIEHDGELGFDAVLSFVVGEELAGKETTLYYYNEAEEKLEVAGTCTVGEDGTVSYKFTHASDYVVIIEKEAYEVTAGKDATWYTDSTDGATFTVDADVNDLIDVYVDGIWLSYDNYTVATDSATVTINKEYLSVLAAGEYTVTIDFIEGTATTTLTIAAPIIEETGDMGTYTMVIVLLGCALVAAGYVSKRKMA